MQLATLRKLTMGDAIGRKLLSAQRHVLYLYLRWRGAVRADHDVALWIIFRVKMQRYL